MMADSSDHANDPAMNICRLILFSFLNLLSGCVYTIQAPFFPTEAGRKGASAGEYSNVFGIYEISVFSTTLILGYIIPKVGAKSAVYFGIILLGCSSIAFGFIDDIVDLQLFLLVSIVIRILEGIGFATFFVAMYSITPFVFPNHFEIATGIIEMGEGLGFSLGPVFGVFLYKVGGFKLPFVILGSIILASMLLFIPSIWNISLRPISETRAVQYSVLQLLRTSQISINFILVFIQTTFLAFLYANMAEYMRLELFAGTTTIGYIFAAFGVFQGLLSPLWGYIFGKLPSANYLFFPGFLFVFTGLLLVGPVPYLGLTTDIRLTFAGVILFATGHGQIIIAAFINAPLQAKNHGFLDNEVAVAKVFSCTLGAFSLGAGIGPPIFGALYDAVGFRETELYAAAAYFSIILFIGVYIFLQENRTKKDEDEILGIPCSNIDAFHEKLPLLQTQKQDTSTIYQTA